MRTDRISAALDSLDAEKRALLELSFWRVLPDEEIARFLRVDAGEVERRRSAGIQDLCRELRLEGSQERRELTQRLRTLSDSDWQKQPRKRGRRPALIALTVVVLAAAVTVLAAVRDDEGSAGRSERAVPPTGDLRRRDAAPIERSSKPVSLRPVAGGPGSGTAQLVREGSTPRLHLRVRALEPPGRAEYVVWLYNAVGDARSIGGSQRGSFRLDARLPKDFSRFRAIDVSREAPDGVPAHGGESVLRAPLARVGSLR